MTLIERQEQLYRQAANLLAEFTKTANAYQAAVSDNLPITAQKMYAKMNQINAEFDEINEKIFPQKQTGVICHREDAVTIAESFDWYPHDHVN